MFAFTVLGAVAIKLNTQSKIPPWVRTHDQFGIDTTGLVTNHVVYWAVTTLL